MSSSSFRNPGLLNLKLLIQSASVDRLGILSRFDDLRAEPLPEETKVRGHWMAMALAAGPQIRITFKVHFMSDSGAQISHKALDLPVGEVTFEKTSDFMKEFCNMTLGLVKQELSEKGFRSVISLALITRGFDEVFFPESSGILLARDFWKIHFAQSFIICSVHIELMESGLDLTVLPSEVTKQDDVGDVEYF